MRITLDVQVVAGKSLVAAASSSAKQQRSYGDKTPEQGKAPMQQGSKLMRDVAAKHEQWIHGGNERTSTRGPPLDQLVCTLASDNVVDSKAAGQTFTGTLRRQDAITTPLLGHAVG